MVFSNHLFFSFPVLEREMVSRPALPLKSSRSSWQATDCSFFLISVVVKTISTPSWGRKVDNHLQSRQAFLYHVT